MGSQQVPWRPDFAPRYDISMTVKLSVSLPDADAAFIDKLAEEHAGNRSAAVQDLVRLAREMRAVDDYAAAFSEWEDSGAADAWDATAADGLTP